MSYNTSVPVSFLEVVYPYERTDGLWSIAIAVMLRVPWSRARDLMPNVCQKMTAREDAIAQNAKILF